LIDINDILLENGIDPNENEVLLYPVLREILREIEGQITDIETMLYSEMETIYTQEQINEKMAKINKLN
jgi:hypothetical protein